MNTSEILAFQAEERTFAATEVGRLFVRFEQAQSTAWATDQRESSSLTAMDRDWKAANDARRELVAAIKALQAKALGASP